MPESCDSKCGSCSKNCAARDMRASLNKDSSVKKVIGIVSGKGGVGKSFVTSLLACTMNKRGKRTAILDADITGPSIPEGFGLAAERATSNDGKVLEPIVTDSGIQLMSMGFLLEQNTDPVIWRGPVIAGAVKQFWSDVVWHDVDYMFVDMPPGTGDVPLTVFQSLPVDGIIVVSSPQQLVRVIVEKAVKMANTMNIPIVGLIENMSYVQCSHCDEKLFVYGKSNIEAIADNYGLPVLAKIPIEEKSSSAIDLGLVDQLDVDYFDEAIDKILSL